ncbi:MAG: hypothetical protein M3324_12090 [Actinomycetota bacterium]|nr:hypothetical protein [Actinomycetota bacterium]
MAEEDQSVPGREGSEADAREADAGTTIDRTSRLARRLEALEHRRRRPEPIVALKLLATDELRRALALIERAGVLPNGEVRSPRVFREAPPEELRALERWRAVCGEPLDHLEAAEELLDRMGELHGWRSPEALDAALLVKRLELPDENPWFVGKMAQAVVSFYAALEEHPDEPRHPRVRGAVRRLERLKEMDRVAPGSGSASEKAGRAEDVEAPHSGPETPPDPRLPAGAPESVREEPERAEPRSSTPGPQEGSERPFTEEEPQPRSWWRRMFGG